MTNRNPWTVISTLPKAGLAWGYGERLGPK